MNLRILKKLSKRAAPLLLEIESSRGHSFEHFKADDGGHTSSTGHDRKHWFRMRSSHGEESGGWIKFRPRKTAHASYPFVAMREPMGVWDGTPMVGWTSGYECPEWDEMTAWDALQQAVGDHTMDYRQVPVEDDDPWGDGYRMEPYSTARVRNPGDVLRIAREMILAHRAAKARQKREHAELLASQRRPHPDAPRRAPRSEGG